MVDDIRMPLTEWTARHNRWADGEVAELEAEDTEGRLQPDMLGNPAQRKRFLRQKYNRLPLFIRPLGLFIYRYFFLSWLSGWNRGTHLLGAANFRVPFSGGCKNLGENARRRVWLESRRLSLRLEMKSRHLLLYRSRAGERPGRPPQDHTGPRRVTRPILLYLLGGTARVLKHARSICARGLESQSKSE